MRVVVVEAGAVEAGAVEAGAVEAGAVEAGAVEAGAGEATNRSRRRRLTVAARAIVVGVRARATFPSYHLGRHLGRLAGC